VDPGKKQARQALPPDFSRAYRLFRNARGKKSAPLPFGRPFFDRPGKPGKAVLFVHPRS